MPTSAERLSHKLRGIGLMMVSAESCTGGLLAAAMTELPGSSEVFERGFITYSYDSKREELDVPAATLKQYGAVSAETAAAMVRGALKHSRAELAVSITGIAGPGGGTEQKPVGLVYIGYGMKDGPVQTTEHNFEGDRSAVRKQTVETALKHLIKFLEALP
jgi:nicotinamide-nucleotide amidase